jgi:transmembrane sensor
MMSEGQSMVQSDDDIPASSAEMMREARRWVARLHSQEVDTAEADALRRWRDQSPAHERAFAEANLRWQLFRSAAINLASRENASIAPILAVKPSSGRIGRRALLGGALAASAAGAAWLAVRPPLDLWPSLEQLTADYRTAIGQQRQLALADTVSVEMNTQTSLSVRPAPSGVIAFEIVSGEISVAAKSPVMAMAGSGLARAEQGAFDLLYQGDTASVACVEGEVSVSCGADSVALRPGQRVIYDHRGLGRLAQSDTTTVQAWRRGLLIFEEVPLSEVVAEINRYRRGRVILMNAALGALPVDATFRIDRIDEAVPRLADVFGAKVRSLPGGIALLG